MQDETQLEGFGVEPSEPEIIIDEELVVDTDDLVFEDAPTEDALVQDIEEVQEEPAQEAPADEESLDVPVRTANYTITGQTDVFDQLGNAIAPLAIGSTIELDVEYGDSLVERNLAVKAEDKE